MSWFGNPPPVPHSSCIEFVMHRCPYCGTEMALPKWSDDIGCYGYCPSCCAGPFESGIDYSDDDYWDYLSFVDGDYATSDRWPPEESC